jgi:hypothetical protein
MPKDIQSIFYSDIKQILQTARKRAYATVNRAMVEAYWLIGKRIVEEEQDGETRAKYGKKTLESLSKSLTHEFGKGFSYANLRNFRQFYLTYPDKKICDTVCSKLSWSHNRLIMRIDNLKTRNYYLTEAVQQQWSVRHLQRNINTLYYERLLSSQHPPLPEQKAIVQKLEKLLAICDQLETRISSNQTHAEQLMQAVLQEAFSQTTKPPKYSNKRV